VVWPSAKYFVGFAFSSVAKEIECFIFARAFPASNRGECEGCAIQDTFAMNKSALLFLAALCSLYANPVIPNYDLSLFGEKVEIICTMQSGHVKGTFTYAASSGAGRFQGAPEVPPEYLGAIFVPVFLPKDSLAAITSINNRDYLRNPYKKNARDVMVEAQYLNVPLKVFNQYRLKDIYPLPKPSEVVPNWFSIPLGQIREIRENRRADAERYIYPARTRRTLAHAGSGKGISINISYRQPTYKYNSQTCFIYTPIIPAMINPEDYAITLKCRSRCMLALITKNVTTASSDTCITVAPMHLETIIVSIAER
jgi:hypothetical protein